MPYLRVEQDPTLGWFGWGPACGDAAIDGVHEVVAPSRPARPRLRVNCPTACGAEAAARCELLRQAIGSAIFLATNAANKLEANPRDAVTRRHFQLFFGHDPSRPVPWAGNQQSGLIVAHRFRKVAEAFRGRGTAYRCDACTGRSSNAFVNPKTERNVINLCPRFWTLAHLAPTSERERRFFRAGIVLHEMLHLLYSSFFRHLRIPPRPDDPQERRRDNSHCYEAFALQLAGHKVDPADLSNCKDRPA